MLFNPATSIRLKIRSPPALEITNNISSNNDPIGLLSCDVALRATAACRANSGHDPPPFVVHASACPNRWFVVQALACRKPPRFEMQPIVLRLRNRHPWQMPLPLPEGEGRGEGEGYVRTLESLQPPSYSQTLNPLP